MSPATTAKAKVTRVRLDQLLVERGLAETRSRAQALVLAGKVRVGEGDAARHDRKAGRPAGPGDARSALPRPIRTSAAAATSSRPRSMRSAIDPAGLVALDVGASTGGFTDVLLQRGASRVYALDVGRGQLAGSLRARLRGSSRWSGRTRAR